ncbi:MAG: phosphatase PAP2 family protein [Gemmatimonadota bacterium]|nr:phosphatase PAP2 family protein [Gemmatimonadota bacterium]
MSTRRSVSLRDLGRIRVALLALLMGASMATASEALAQRLPADTLRSSNPNQQLFRGRDITLLVGAFVVSSEIAHFDTKVAHYTQSPSVQGDSGRLRLVKRLTKANETTLTAGALVAYGIGRLAHIPVLTDVSAHVGEALLITNVVSQAIRGPFGRARPYVTHDDQNSDFHVGKGFTSYDYRSLPSLHSASAFAAASALTAEINERHPGAAWPVGAVLYTAASIPGLTRMYLDQNWASDVVMGGFLGAFIGHKVVVHAHANPRNRLDRLLLGTTVVPEGGGAYAVSWHAALP